MDKAAMSLRLGPPHLWAWQGAVSWLLEMVKAVNSPESLATATKVEGYCNEVKRKGHTDLCKEIKYFRLQECYESAFWRLEVNIVNATHSHEVWNLLLHAFVNNANQKFDLIP